jgi:hypothetical protein
MTDQESVLSYYQRATCSSQWLEFNRALAVELSAGLPPEEIRLLFRRIGERMAATMPVERCDTVRALREQMNQRWDAIGWGFADLHEQDDHLRITHACSPLAMAFGAESAGWACGFFEGAYQSWFAAQGIPASLRVRADTEETDAGADAVAATAAARQVVLRLGRFQP